MADPSATIDVLRALSLEYKLSQAEIAGIVSRKHPNVRGIYDAYEYTNSLEGMPPEIIYEIFKGLSYEDQEVLCSTNRYFAQFCEDEYFKGVGLKSATQVVASSANVDVGDIVYIPPNNGNFDFYVVVGKGKKTIKLAVAYAVAEEEYEIPAYKPTFLTTPNDFIRGNGFSVSTMAVAMRLSDHFNEMYRLPDSVTINDQRYYRGTRYITAGVPDAGEPTKSVFRVRPRIGTPDRWESEVRVKYSEDTGSYIIHRARHNPVILYKYDPDMDYFATNDGRLNVNDTRGIRATYINRGKNDRLDNFGAGPDPNMYSHADNSLRIWLMANYGVRPEKYTLSKVIKEVRKAIGFWRA